jgi:calcineurin-like phosphoesterase family protein
MRRKFSVEDRIWFTSDTHFGHSGILFMRPFETVSKMNQILIQKWNDSIEPTDHVFHLGDFSFHKPVETLEILGSLNGIKYLIRGNHDRNNLNAACLAMFDGGVEHYHEITVGSQLIVLCHFPFRSWNGMHHDSWNLHGHSHGSIVPSGKQLDVGVDVAIAGAPKFSPKYIEAVRLDMANKKFVRTDHHGSKREDYVARAVKQYVCTCKHDISNGAGHADDCPAEAYIKSESGDLSQ